MASFRSQTKTKPHSSTKTSNKLEYHNAKLVRELHRPASEKLNPLQFVTENLDQILKGPSMLDPLSHLMLSNDQIPHSPQKMESQNLIHASFFMKARRTSQDLPLN